MAPFIVAANGSLQIALGLLDCLAEVWSVVW
jgi:hypothetical protein